jgi:hypothetical protein
MDLSGFGMGAVDEGANNEIIGRIPEPAEKHEQPHRHQGNTKHIGTVKHKVKKDGVAYQAACNISARIGHFLFKRKHKKPPKQNFEA